MQCRLVTKYKSKQITEKIQIHPISTFHSMSKHKNINHNKSINRVSIKRFPPMYDVMCKTVTYWC